MNRLSSVHTALLKITQAWASRQKHDLGQAAELRREAALLNHAAYMRDISAYQRLAREQRCEKVKDLSDIKDNCMLPVGLFKSYEPNWLDQCDFPAMDRWLSSIFRKRVSTSASKPASVDNWIDHLAGDGTAVSYSSGTSGRMSFVARDHTNWSLLRTANRCYLAPLLTFQILSTPLTQSMMGRASRLLSPGAMAALVGKIGLADFDAVFLGFRRGSTGNQMLIRELGPLFRRQCFLYDIDLSATALACLQRGARNEEEACLVDRFRQSSIENRENSYGRVIAFIKAATDCGQKVFLFGAPYQFKELCEYSAGTGMKTELKEGSLVLFGGGWKSFSGEAINRDVLVSMISEAFNLPPERVLEGYSMTELSLAMLRCSFGRFHIPPLIEPIVFDEELHPVDGKYEVWGAFGFIDSLAVSYPGFLISDDRVKLVDGDCGCGLVGPAVTEIGRVAGREVKGCAGIMSSMKA